MAARRKPSVFTALNQLRVTEASDSDDDNAEERQQERKDKQKQKKKSRSNKRNRQLKNLAFVSVSKSKKSKKNKMQSQSPVDETVISNGEDKKEVVEPKCSLEKKTTKTTLQPQKTSPKHPGIDKKPILSAPQQQTIDQVSKKQQKKKAASPPKQETQSSQQPTLTPSPIGATPPISAPQSSSKTELGAVYTPAHITITRVDGQMKRTVAVTEVMDQLLRYTQQNSQLLMVQEQLGHANRSLQDQLQRSAEIINGLQNEVALFRQMCLNMQAELSLLRSNGAPDAGKNPQSHHRPPPGMS
ncbi:unnamed protein product [Peronospora destructor]|uniref:Uncharacterized protein n=1 Tax=Peronospora destructor TaxID=86335 RepID=A0AAV0T4R5_9STRA|nr:unnamed protein product [Peronospora destructor]